MYCQNMQEGITQVVANEQALTKLTANKGALLKTCFYLTGWVKPNEIK